MSEVKKISEYSIKELREICQASAPNPARESIAGRFTRFFSIYTTKWLLYTKLSPNQITVLSTLVFFIGISIYFIDISSVRVMGAFLVFLSVVLDGSDGEVARFRISRSTVGVLYVEPVSHDIQYGFSFPLYGLALFHIGYNPLYLLLGGITAIFKLESRFLQIRFWKITNNNITAEDVKKIEKSYYKMPEYKRAAYWIEKNFFSSPSFYVILFFTSLINRPEYFLWFYGVGYLLFFAALFVKQVYKINIGYIK